MAHEVTNSGSDRAQLANMAKRAKGVLRTETLDAVADRGYFSQEALAVDAGIDRTYVSRLERGLENPSVAVLEKLAIALKSSIPDLFIAPAKGEAPPRPLKAGRRPRK